MPFKWGSECWSFQIPVHANFARFVLELINKLVTCYLCVPLTFAIVFELQDSGWKPIYIDPTSAIGHKFSWTMTKLSNGHQEIPVWTRARHQACMSWDRQKKIMQPGLISAIMCEFFSLLNIKIMWVKISAHHRYMNQTQGLYKTWSSLLSIKLGESGLMPMAMLKWT